MPPQYPAPRRKKYGRVSSDEQDKMGTIDSQMRAVDDWDRAHGGDPQPDDWYIDEGWSGFNMERPALDRLRDDAHRPGRTWHEVVIYDTSRLSRAPLHRLGILEPELRELGITVLYVASPMYPDTADGRAMAVVQGAFDQWFAEKAKETMRRGLRDSVKRGTCWWAPFGYVVHKTLDPRTSRAVFEIVVHPEQAAVVREIYAAVLDGRSTPQIARDLNARGVPTRRGAHWHPTTIREIIYDPYYIGLAGFGKTERVKSRKKDTEQPAPRRRRPKTAQVARPREEWWAEITVPALITPEEQERAIAVLQGNQRRKAQPSAVQYALRGLLHCTLHQHEDKDYTLIGRAPKRADGTLRRIYRCGWRNFAPRPGEPLACRNQLPGSETEDLVWDALIAALQCTDDLHANLAAIEDAPRRERAQWEGAIARLADQRERLRGQVRIQQRLREQGTYSDTEYEIARADVLPALESCERALAHAQHSLAQVHTPSLDVGALEDLCARIATGAAKAGPDKRGAMLTKLITHIDVYADRLEIHGYLGDITVPLPERYQLNTDGAVRNKPVSFCLTIPRCGPGLGTLVFRAAA